MIKVSGTKVRVGSGGCTKSGLSVQQIKQAELEFRNSGSLRKNPSDNIYLIKGRKPLLMLHIIESSKDDPNNEKIPNTLFALGVGFPASEEKDKTANYVVNMVEINNWIELDDNNEYDEYAYSRNFK